MVSEMKQKLIMLLVLILIPILFSSCLFVKWMFRQTEDIPENMKEMINLSTSDLFPDGLAAVIPGDLKEELDKQTQKEFLRSFLTKDMVDTLVNLHFNGQSSQTAMEIPFHFENEAHFSQHFDEIKIPVESYTHELEEIVNKDFFTGVKNKIDEKASDIWFSPELEVYDLKLKGKLKADIVNPHLSGGATINTDLYVSKNDFDVNERAFLKDVFLTGQQKEFDFDPASEWILIALINTPSDMYCSGNLALDLNLSASDITVEGDYDANMDLIITIIVNDVNNPVDGGYTWNITSLDISKFLISNVVLKDYVLEDPLLKVVFQADGTISVKLK